MATRGTMLLNSVLFAIVLCTATESILAAGTSDGSETYYYLGFPNRKSFNDARDTCREYGGELAKAITNADEEFIIS